MATAILTTGKVAKLLGVCPRTAANMLDRGDIPCHRLGHNQDRRVRLEDLVKFVQSRQNFPRDEIQKLAIAHGLPLVIPPTLLVCSPSPKTMGEYHGAGWRPTWADHAYTAGRFGFEHFDLVLVDQQLGSDNVDAIVAKRREEWPHCRFAILACEDDTRGALGWQVQYYAQRPVDFAELAGQLLDWWRMPGTVRHVA